MLVPAKNNDDVIGIITNSAGFIANAGQFSASERIEYDLYGNPIIKLNISDNLKTEESLNSKIIKINDENIKFFKNIENIKIDQLQSPAFLTVPKANIDRSIPFVPFNERPKLFSSRFVRFSCC